jgi:hypothetical protein
MATTSFQHENLQETDQSKNLSIGGRIILKRVLKYDRKLWTGLIYEVSGSHGGYGHDSLLGYSSV